MSDRDPDAPSPEGGRGGDTPGGPERAADAGVGTAADAVDGQYAKFGRYVNYAVLAGLLLLAFVAVVQLYFAASSVIGTWVAPAYRAPFRAAFNLVVLLLAGLGVSLQLRRLRG